MELTAAPRRPLTARPPAESGRSMRRRGALRTLVEFVDGAEESGTRDHALRAVQNLACEGALGAPQLSCTAWGRDLNPVHCPEEGAEAAVRAGVLERFPEWLGLWTIRNARVLAGIFTNIAAARTKRHLTPYTLVLTPRTRCDCSGCATRGFGEPRNRRRCSHCSRHRDGGALG